MRNKNGVGPPRTRTHPLHNRPISGPGTFEPGCTRSQLPGVFRVSCDSAVCLVTRDSLKQRPCHGPRGQVQEHNASDRKCLFIVTYDQFAPAQTRIPKSSRTANWVNLPRSGNSSWGRFPNSPLQLNRRPTQPFRPRALKSDIPIMRPTSRTFDAYPEMTGRTGGA